MPRVGRGNLMDETNLFEVLDFWTTPTEGDPYEQKDCHINIWANDCIVITYPDKSEIVLCRKDNRWIDSEQLKPTGFGMPGN
jgi:hypothetical protein